MENRTHRDPANSSTPRSPSSGDAKPIADVLRPIRERFAHLAEPDEVYVRRERELQERETADEEARRQAAWRAFIAERGLRYEACTLENFEVACGEQRDAVNSLARYRDELAERIRGGRGVVLIGPPGTGKDHLLIPLARAAILAGERVEWANGQDLFGKFREAIKEDGSEHLLVKKFGDAAVLLLSDPIPPTGPLSPYQAAMLFTIIDRRYRNCRPTWVTMNVAGSDEARAKLGSQVVDRLAHDALVVACNWSSWRRPES